MDAIADLDIAEIDPTTLRVQLTELFRAAGTAEAARPKVLALFKDMWAAALTHAEHKLMRDGDGRACAAYLSGVQDEIVSAIHDYTAAHVYFRPVGSVSESIAIVATGGYGRGLLAPGSDIDLLFLLPYKQTPWAESVVEYALYLLWDIGYKVGHATRTVEQCVKLSRNDVTIRTALLDARLIHGDTELFARFEERFVEDVGRASARAYIEAKMAERDQRHKRSGASRFLVEPNIKDGKGGLRDLHTLHWLSKFLADGGRPGGEVEHTELSPKERVTLRRCEDFLWTVRCHLHFLSGRAEERLTFDVQPEMAARLRYRTSRGLRAVERFMKHYFLVAKTVGDLTAVVSLALELEQLKTAPRLNEMINPLTWSTRRTIRQQTDFRIENDRVTIADSQVFARNPRNFLRIFEVAEDTGSYLHPDALRGIQRSLHLLDDDLRSDPQAAGIFFNLLTKSKQPEAILRQLHGTGVLGRYIPEFARVTAMMQFNMYHHYTVDEHLLRTVGELRSIEDGKRVESLPLSSGLFPTIKNRRALYLAALIHDIGKGRAEDHSIVGARLALSICRRLGLDSTETQLVVWLVEQHLLMSTTAQTRDLADPRTITGFSDVVTTRERLKLLLLLTVADIRAVGPGTWNGWKGQLLRQLYSQADVVISDETPGLTPDEQMAESTAALRARLTDWTDEQFAAFTERQYPDYWGRIELKTQVAHARLLRDIEADGRKLGTAFSTDRFTAITELVVIAPNHARLLSLFAGCCSAAGANILGAHIATTRDGLVLDSFLLARELGEDEDELRRTRQIGEMIERVLRGDIRLTQLLDAKRPAERRVEAFSVAPQVRVDNELSDQFTVIEVEGRDRPRLLYDLTAAISDLNLDITSAHITTFGERAVDVFYVSDLTGKKIIHEARQKSIEDRLLPILASDVG
ncbi:MAG: [protein-PII] uridylyltransferase [Pseudomonadota bacterium]